MANTHEVLPEHAGNEDVMHFFMLVKTTRHWLDLPNEQRQAFFENEVYPIVAARPQVTVQYFEPEAFSARATDILVWRTSDISAWCAICDQLRETRFWDHYFEVLEILPSIQANYFEALSAA